MASNPPNPFGTMDMRNMVDPMGRIDPNKVPEFYRSQLQMGNVDDAGNGTYNTQSGGWTDRQGRQVTQIGGADMNGGYGTSRGGSLKDPNNRWIDPELGEVTTPDNWLEPEDDLGGFGMLTKAIIAAGAGAGLMGWGGAGAEGIAGAAGADGAAGYGMAGDYAVGSAGVGGSGASAGGASMAAPAAGGSALSPGGYGMAEAYTGVGATGAAGVPAAGGTGFSMPSMSNLPWRDLISAGGNLLMNRNQQDMGEAGAQDREYNERMWNRALQANRPNQVTPFGSSEWKQDPVTGQWTQTSTLNSQDQGRLDQFRGIAAQRMGAAGNIQPTGKPVNWGAVNPRLGQLADSSGYNSSFGGSQLRGS